MWLSCPTLCCPCPGIFGLNCYRQEHMLSSYSGPFWAAAAFAVPFKHFRVFCVAVDQQPHWPHHNTRTLHTAPPLPVFGAYCVCPPPEQPLSVGWQQVRSTRGPKHWQQVGGGRRSGEGLIADFVHWDGGQPCCHSPTPVGGVAGAGQRLGMELRSAQPHTAAAHLRAHNKLHSRPVGGVQVGPA